MKLSSLLATLVAFTFTTAAYAGGEGVFAYPNATGVVVAGPPDTEARICYYEDDVFDLNLPADAQTVVPVWECDFVQLYGGKAPVWYFFKHKSPVKVSNARWAYALKKRTDWKRSTRETVVEAATQLNAEETIGGYKKKGNYDAHTLGFRAIDMQRYIWQKDAK